MTFGLQHGHVLARLRGAGHALAGLALGLFLSFSPIPASATPGESLSGQPPAPAVRRTQLAQGIGFGGIHVFSHAVHGSVLHAARPGVHGAVSTVGRRGLTERSRTLSHGRGVSRDVAKTRSSGKHGLTAKKFDKSKPRGSHAAKPSLDKPSLAKKPLTDSATHPKSDAYVGKPDNVAHNPQHGAGDFGLSRDHKPATIDRDGHFFERKYYFVPGAVPVWYWFDEPLPGVPQGGETFLCDGGTDHCRPRPLPDGPKPFAEGGATVHEDNTDLGGGLYYRETFCNPAVLKARHAYAICAPDQKWHINTHNYYCCPPETGKSYVTTTPGPAIAACGPGAGYTSDKPPEPAKVPQQCVGQPAQPALNQRQTWCDHGVWHTLTWHMVEMNCPPPGPAQYADQTSPDDDLTTNKCGADEEPPFDKGATCQ